jgi:hypothetical protein
MYSQSGSSQSVLWLGYWMDDLVSYLDTRFLFSETLEHLRGPSSSLLNEYRSPFADEVAEAWSWFIASIRRES